MCSFSLFCCTGRGTIAHKKSEKANSGASLLVFFFFRQCRQPYIAPGTAFIRQYHNGSWKEALGQGEVRLSVHIYVHVHAPCGGRVVMKGREEYDYGSWPFYGMASYCLSACYRWQRRTAYACGNMKSARPVIWLTSRHRARATDGSFAYQTERVVSFFNISATVKSRSHVPPHGPS